MMKAAMMKRMKCVLMLFLVTSTFAQEKARYPVLDESVASYLKSKRPNPSMLQGIVLIAGLVVDQFPMFDVADQLAPIVHSEYEVLVTEIRKSLKVPIAKTLVDQINAGLAGEVAKKAEVPESPATDFEHGASNPFPDLTKP